MNEAALTTQNWEAFLQLELRRGGHRTRLVPRKRYGPLTVQRPFYPEAECCHVYLLHPPGGIVGGDRLELQVDVDNDAEALLTTPGAAKFYLSAGQTAQLRQSFRIAGGAQLEFLPLENIYFPGAEVRSRTSIDVDPGGRFMLWEKHCFGRPANNEFFARGRLHARIELRSEGKLLFTETQRVDGAELRRSSGMRGHPVSGSFLVYGAELETGLLRELQQIEPESGVGAISQIDSKLLVARCIGSSTRDLDAYFVTLWESLRPVLGRREACHPRIWNT